MNKESKSNLQKCPCGSGNEYMQCCGQFIADSKIPATPEQLMRSRYTAYTMLNIDYIQATMLDDALASFDRKESLRWAQTSKWLGLQIISASGIDDKDVEGDVKFIVSYIQNHQVQHVPEHSKFKKHDDRWFFVGDFAVNNMESSISDNNIVTNSSAKIIKIGRNELCHCGSGKKYKKCCLK